MHQTGRTLYPFRGFETETGSGAGAGYTINVPLEPKSDDDTFAAAFDRVVMRAIRSYSPDLLVVQLGVDMLHGDPLTDLNVTNNSYAYAAGKLASLGIPLVALGGGGYQRESYITANALMWVVMNGIEHEEGDMSGLVGGVFLGETGLKSPSLREARRYTQEPQKSALMQSLERTIAWLEQNVPLLRKDRDPD